MTDSAQAPLADRVYAILSERIRRLESVQSMEPAGIELISRRVCGIVAPVPRCGYAGIRPA
jgi:hypothetical protein